VDLPAGLEYVTEETKAEAIEVLSNAIAGSASNDPEKCIEWMLGPEFKGKWENDPDRKVIYDYMAGMTCSVPLLFGKVDPGRIIVAARANDGKIGAVMSADRFPQSKAACCFDCGACCKLMSLVMPPWRKKCSERLKAEGPNVEKRMGACGKASDEIHEKDAPKKHWYLTLVGVDPKYQGQGLGGKMVKFLNLQSDADNLPCYLQTTVERNPKIYERYGYKVVGEAHEMKCDGVETLQHFWSMTRPIAGNP